METPDGTAVGAERSDAARNRARLLAATRRLVSEHGAEHVTVRRRRTG